MGKIFLQHSNGLRFFQCKSCKTNLARKKDLVSTKFTGATGKAYLFKTVVNVVPSSNAEERNMLTGRHHVRDVRCKVCKIKLGWMYEFAREEEQRYKEMSTILECELIQEQKGFEDLIS